MDAFIRSICLFTFTFLIGQEVYGLDRGSIPFRDQVADEFMISSDDRIDGNDIAEDLFSADNEVVNVDETDVDCRKVTGTIAVTNGGTWGTWGPVQYCPDGSYAIGYDMRIEPKQYGGDDTALNAIKLICENLEGTETGEITSIQGDWGYWVGQTRCPSVRRKREYLTSFDLQVEKWQGSHGDDTAANYIKFRCSCGCGSQHEIVRWPGYGLWGKWGAWSNQCPHGSSICGIQTRVESPQGKGDDTALNDVKFVCCSIKR